MSGVGADTQHDLDRLYTLTGLELIALITHESVPGDNNYAERLKYAAEFMERQEVWGNEFATYFFRDMKRMSDKNTGANQ